ncbi:hypothetical protein EGW08_003957 [Elysia chlorotica]|uniref:C-type lectin domain-containing protein n=1 Tax=Elysia chlorotica TaxID=188477 RepID=A0A433U373_ELYCH|nr:hypothetical protein EGW08_003957 [Elysia chlorotica]
MIEDIDSNVKLTLSKSQSIFDVVQRLEPKVDKIDSKVMDIDLRTRIIRTIQRVDKQDYHISDVHNDRVYVYSKQEVAFELKKENDKCELMGGYLLELDDEAEKLYTLDLAKKIGGDARFALGGNDVATEGTWVYYHSKKPVPSDVQWLPGEPNNHAAGENCMAFRMTHNGLNDFPCGQNARFICELPLAP